MPIKDLEEYLSKTHYDDRKHEPVTIPNDMPPIHAPEHQMDIRTHTWREVERTVKHARSALAPRPNGVPYSLYKNAPGEANEGGMEKGGDSESMEKSRWHPDPQREGLVIHRPVLSDQPVECGEEDFLQHCCPKALCILAKK